MSSNKPLPTFAGPTLPLNVDLHDNEDDLMPSRRAAGAIVFDEPLLQSSPVDFTNDSTMDARLAKMSTGPSKMTPSGSSKPSSGWNEKLLQDVPALPAMFTLEPTTVFVPNASVARVADRIASVLRERSIEAHFYPAAKASCTTLEGVEFCIRLYRGRENYNHGIIVEVQRRYGTCRKFHKDTLAILRAAENKPTTPQYNDSLPAVVSDTEDDQENDRRKGVLDMVAKMIQHPGTQRLALETLITFTDSTKMGNSTARTTSLQLLEPGNSVLAKVISIIIVDNKGLRVMAMEALANALQNTGASPCSLPKNKLKSLLVQDLSDSDSNPRVAYMAARCLEPLLLLDANHDDNEELYQALQHSIAVGQAKHAALAQQALKCIDRL